MTGGQRANRLGPGAEGQGGGKGAWDSQAEVVEESVGVLGVSV